MTLPLVPAAPEIHAPPADKLLYTWIGHATGMVQLDGITVLTDPIFSDRCGGMRFVDACMLTLASQGRTGAVCWPKAVHYMMIVMI